MTNYTDIKFLFILNALLLTLFVASQIPAQKPELVIQSGHRNMIKALVLSSDGKLLASAGADKTIILWDVVSEKQILTLTGHEGWIFALAFSPNKKYLASGSYDGIVKVWNLQSMKIEFEISTIKPHNITSLAFSADGNLLAIASANDVINLCDIQTGNLKQPLEEHTSVVTQVTFLPDGKTLASSSLDKTIRFWDYSARKVKKVVEIKEGVTGFAYNPGQTLLAVATDKDVIGVFEFKDYELKKDLVTINSESNFSFTEQFKYQNWRLGFARTGIYSPEALYFSSENELTFVNGNKLSIWDVSANREKTSQKTERGFGAYAVTGYQENNLLIYSDSANIRLLNLLTQEQKELNNEFILLDRVAFSLDGRTLMSHGGYNETMEWGAKKRSFTVEEARAYTRELYNQPMALLWSPKMLAKINPDDPNQTNIYLTQDNGKIVAVLEGHKAPVTAIVINPDETALASVSKDGTTRLWDLKTRKVIKILEVSGSLIQFSPNGKYLAISDEEKLINIFDMEDLEKKPVVIEANVNKAMLFSPDSKILAAINIIDYISPGEDTSTLWFIDRFMRHPEMLTLWSVKDGERLSFYNLYDPVGEYELFCPECVMGHKSNTEPLGYIFINKALPYLTVGGPVAFCKNKNLIASSLIDPVRGNYHLKVWNTLNGKEVNSFIGHTNAIRSVAFSPNGEILASAGWDGTLKLWKLETNKELATLVPLNKDNWIIYMPDGRFDTNLDIREMNKLSWIWSSDPFSPLSLRVFMRDYYEPKLLQKLLAGETLKSVRDLSKLNRTQPAVSIKSIKPDDVGTVEVTVEVAGVLSKNQTDVKGAPLQSGVFNVMLFRNYQLVASSVSDETLANYNAQFKDSENAQAFELENLDQWRKANEVKIDRDGKATLTFHKIKLPQSSKIKEVIFSAYAFNNDRVTGETANYIYKLPPQSTPLKPRAYIVTVGVDANQSGSTWSLNLATKSAVAMQQLLSDKLSKNYETITVPLMSTFEPDSPRVALDHATKENIENVLSILAGKIVTDKERRNIPNVNSLRTATPDDMVVIYIASHGYTDPNGNFYVIPYNTGSRNRVTEQTLNDCLSRRPSQISNCDSERNFIQNSISGSDLSIWWRSVDAGKMIMVLDSCHSATAAGKDFKPGPLGDRSFGQLSYDKGMIILAATQKAALLTPRAEIKSTLLSNALVNISNTAPQQTLVEWLEETEYKVPEQYKKLYPQAKAEEIQTPVLFNFSKGNN